MSHRQQVSVYVYVCAFYVIVLFILLQRFDLIINFRCFCVCVDSCGLVRLHRLFAVGSVQWLCCKQRTGGIDVMVLTFLVFKRMYFVISGNSSVSFDFRGTIVLTVLFWM